MDGQPIAERLEGTPLFIDPGAHTFSFETPGQPRAEKYFVIREGEKDSARANRLRGDHKRGGADRERAAGREPVDSVDCAAIGRSTGCLRPLGNAEESGSRLRSRRAGGVGDRGHLFPGVRQSRRRFQQGWLLHVRTRERSSRLSVAPRQRDLGGRPARAWIRFRGGLGGTWGLPVFDRRTLGNGSGRCARLALVFGAVPSVRRGRHRLRRSVLSGRRRQA